MKGNILSVLLAVVGLIAMTGCEEDEKFASVPSYGDMEVSGNIYTGQKAKASVGISYAGAYVL